MCNKLAHTTHANVRRKILQIAFDSQTSFPTKIFCYNILSPRVIITK